MFKFVTQIKLSLRDLSRSKLKTALSILGIFIGVFAVVVLQSFGQGLDAYVRQQFESLGANTLYIVPGNVLGSRSGAASVGTSIQFDTKDINSLKRLPLTKRIVPAAMKRTTATAQGNKKSTDVYATTEELFALRNLNAEYGELFRATDVQSQRKIAVIGPKIATELFSSPSAAIGKLIEINKQRFMVVGVLEEQGGVSLGGPDYDSYMYIPYTAASGLLDSGKFALIYLQTFSQDQILPLQTLAQGTLLKRYKKDDFSVIEQGQILAVANSIFQVINVVLLVIGSVSLLVGGIGIMNIMYATVTERIKEIGIRRALGAKRSDILSMFLIESVVLSLIGGIIGLGLSVVVVSIIQRFFPLSITVISVLVAVGVSCAIGLFFGVFPAQRAAKLPPIEAIRYE